MPSRVAKPYPPPSYAPRLRVQRITDVVATTRTIGFADSAEVWWYDESYNPVPAFVRESLILALPSDSYPNVHFRHSGGTANVLFVDGHVESMTSVDNPLPTNPADPFGWPSDAIALKDRSRIADLSLAATDQYFTLDQ